MTKLFLHNLVDNKYFSKIKQINHEGKIYYELIIDNNFDRYPIVKKNKKDAIEAPIPK